MRRFTTALTSLLATLSVNNGASAFCGHGGWVTAAALLPTARGGAVRSATEDATCTDEATATTSSFDELVSRLQDVTHLSRASAVLGYDQMVFMPQTDEASQARGQQSAALAGVIHEKSTAPQIGDLLDMASDVEGLDKTRVVELARKAYDKKVKIPTELATQQASLSAEAYNTWAKARAADDFSMFQDILGQEINVALAVAGTVQTPQDKADNKSLYATMLDEFEVGMDADRMDDIFQQIQDALVPLIDKVFEATAPKTDLLTGEFEITNQEALSKAIVKAIGFDETRGRIDVSVHPFSSSLSGKHDVRITSRFRTDEWYQGLAGSMHEAGHAMYEQNVPDSGLPLIDSALSMGMHESQSLFWERHIGLSKAFWKYATPLAKEHLGLECTPEQLYGAVNAASRSLIRVEADELTYPLHVILRYNIEREFVEGRLNVKDIPTKWNEGMKSMLKVDVPSDAQGCLQDVHWSMMAFGYFPTYLIGAAAAAQLAHYCQKDIPDLDAKVEAGEFDDIRAWMTEKVHQHGSRYKRLDEHLEAQLGEPLNPKYFIDYLTDKYTELYQC